MGALLGAARGPSRRAPGLVRDRFNSQAATASWGPSLLVAMPRLPLRGRPRVGQRDASYPPGVDLSPLYDHLTAPRGQGRSLPHSASAGGAPCGDLIRIGVQVAGDRVVAAGHHAEGCAAARAAGSAVVELVSGAPFLDAAHTTPQAIADELGGLSPERMHAAHLAADALHRALGETSPQLEPDPNRTLVAMSGGVGSRIADDGSGRLLRAGADPAKDQSYMLARLRPDELERLWFPLGELTKPAVRELARAAELPVADRPESQDLCFLSGTNVDAFMGGR